MTTEELTIAVAKLLGWKVYCTEDKHPNWIIEEPNGHKTIMGPLYTEDGLWTLLYRMKLPRYASNLNLACPLLKGLPLALTFLSRMLEADQSPEDVAYYLCSMYVQVNTNKLIPLPEKYPYPEAKS